MGKSTAAPFEPIESLRRPQRCSVRGNCAVLKTSMKSTHQITPTNGILQLLKLIETPSELPKLSPEPTLHSRSIAVEKLHQEPFHAISDRRQQSILQHHRLSLSSNIEESIKGGVQGESNGARRLPMHGPLRKSRSLHQAIKHSDII